MKPELLSHNHSSAASSTRASPAYILMIINLVMYRLAQPQNYVIPETIISRDDGCNTGNARDLLSIRRF